jgi:hypothetical protein
MNHYVLLSHQGDTYEVHVRQRIIVRITKLIGGVVPREVSYFDLPPALQNEILTAIHRLPSYAE